MIINGIETYSNRTVCLVHIFTDRGDGWGMTAPFEADITAQVVHRLAAPLVLNKEFNNFQDIADEIILQQYKFTGTFVARAAAGIDTALWDVVAKAEGKTVADYIGRKTKEPVQLYGSSMLRNPEPISAEAERLSRLRERYGFRCFKIHPGISVGKDADHYPGCTEEFIRVVREALPQEVGLWIDVNGNYSVRRAIEMAHYIKKMNCDLFEEPCPYWLLDDVKQVHEECKKIGLPVAAGEQDYMETQWNKMISEKIIDVAQPDILYIGGFSRTLRIAKSCAQAGIPVTPHTGHQSPLLVFGITLMSVVDMPHEFMECGIEAREWEHAMYRNPLVIADGQASTLSGNGWGLEIDANWLAKSQYQVSR